MTNVIADIPLQGNEISSAADRNGTAVLGNFLAGPENRLVEIAVRSVAAGKPNGYNPLFLHGPSGTGKSHLAAGMAAAWRSRDRRGRIVHTSAADFARELAEAVDTQALDEFRAKHRRAELLIVEDLHRLVSRRSEKLNTQEELIHTLDAMTAEDRWVVVTAASAPGELKGIVPSLQSRLIGGLCVSVSAPGPEARLAILNRLAAARGADLPDESASLLADCVSGTAPELAGALAELTASGRASRRRLDLEAVREYIERRGAADQPDMHEIALASARYFKVKLSEMRGPSRRRTLVAARGAAMYLARTKAKKSYEEIGRYFGGRDHTTVLHGCRKIEEEAGSDPSIRQALDRLDEVLWKK